MKKGIIVLWLFFVAFFFCSCAKKQEATSPAGPQEGSWKEKGFVAPKKEASDELYWVGDILSWQDGETTEDG